MIIHALCLFIINKKNNIRADRRKQKPNAKIRYKKELLKLVIKGCQQLAVTRQISGIEFHSIGAATKNNCLNAFIVELTRLNQM